MYFIVNETACSGECGIRFTKVERLLSERGISYTVVKTERRGHGVELARFAVSRGEKRIIAVGGDGTVREVASALVNTDAALGILPFGTGNDIAKPLNIPTETEPALNALLNGKPRPVDCGRVNDSYFFNIAGMGFDVDVLVETERFKKKRKGMLPYLLGVMSAVVHKKKIPMKITLDGKERNTELLMIDIANGKYFGGGMKVAPDASPFDGLFDVVMVKYVSLLRFLTLLPSFIKGGHIKYAEVTVCRAKTVDIELEDGDELPIQTDGEIDNVTPARISMECGAVNIILPEE